MKAYKKHKLWDKDLVLFETMKSNYQSDTEREFFEKMRTKQEEELTLSNDLIMSEKSNEDQIYIVRVYYEEYLVGHGTAGNYDPEQHTMNLSEALDLNLKQCGYIHEDLTLFQWLRRRDYKGVMYDHNYDYL